MPVETVRSLGVAGIVRGRAVDGPAKCCDARHISKTDAEGVETEQQFRLLHAAGVNVVQGSLFGRPCPARDLDFDRVGDDRPAESAA